MAASSTIPCTFSSCKRAFRDEREMVRHKISDPDHEYCHRCKADFDTEEEMFMHLIMSPKHIACPYCSQEFKSQGGVTIHIEKSHRRSADLVCVGCDLKFVRASHYMHHIETGGCEILTREAWNLQRAQKQLIKDAFQMQLNAEEGEGPFVRSNDAKSVDDTESGGVSLPLMDTENPPMSEARHRSEARNALEERRRRLNIDVAGVRRLYQRQYETNNQDWPELGGPAYKTNTNAATLDEDLIDLQSRLSLNPKYKWNEATGTSTAHRLFPEAENDRSQPSSNLNVQDIPRSAEATNAGGNASNDRTAGLEARSVTSVSGGYGVFSFFDGIIGKFVCPSSQCARKFDKGKEFQDHLIGPAHTGGSSRCPLCFRTFNNAYGLVAHCENSTAKCKINKSSNYNQILREITGDLIGTDGHGEDGSVIYVADPDVLPKPGQWPARI